MKKKVNSISLVSAIGLKVQGYTSCSVIELSEFRLGIRFAYGTCAALVLMGLILQNVTFHGVVLAISVGGMIPPRHPVDYVYNALIRHVFNKPAIPGRPPQSRFACSLASVWMLTALYCWNMEYYWITNAMAGALLMQACIVTFTDICFPSMIFNFFTKVSVAKAVAGHDEN